MGFGASQSTSQQGSKPQLSAQQMLQLYAQYLPTISNVANQQETPTAQAIAGGVAAANPIYTGSTAQQLAAFAPFFSAMGTNLAGEQASGTNRILNGAGGDAATSAVNLNNRLNPVQGATNTGALNLLNSISLNGLSPGESNAIERSNNQNLASTNNLGVNNGTNTIANAENFGGAFNNKVNIFGQALGQAGGVASNQNNQVNPVNTAFTASNPATNFGLSLFNPNMGVTNATAPINFASSFGSQLGGVSTAPISSGQANSHSFNTSGGGCFLTTACCEWLGLSDDCFLLSILRAFRDSSVSKELVKQYYEIAPTISKMVKTNTRVLSKIYKTILECVKYILLGLNDKAVESYTRMFQSLRLQYSI